MADLYRKSSLERMSSPEQLDKVIKVTSPLSWLALIAVTIIIAAALIWAFTGELPETVTVHGYITEYVGSNGIYIKEPGTVFHPAVTPGTRVYAHDPANSDGSGTLILTYHDSSNNLRSVYSDQDGIVVKISEKDAVVDAYESVAIIKPVSHYADARQMVVCYVPMTHSKDLKPDMEANVTLDGRDSQFIGHMSAQILNIDAYATRDNVIASAMGSGDSGHKMTTEELESSNTVAAVACELLQADPHDPSARNPYWWSNAKGRGEDVPNISKVTVKFTVKTVKPISKLGDMWNKFQEFLGG